MRRSLPYLLVAVAVALSAQAPPPSASYQIDAGWKALGAGHYRAAVEIFRTAAFGPGGVVRDELAYQSWRQVSPMVLNELPLKALDRDPGASRPDEAGTAQVRRATARDALAEIVARARATSIVILNEAHDTPRDRAFGLEVARALRPLGYAVLAAETFDNGPGLNNVSATARLARDGVVRLGTGSYTKDPVFAGFVRQAVAMGYRPVAYEETPAQAAKGGDVAIREQAQCDNLIAAIFARDRDAKVLIHVGYSHVADAPIAGAPGTTSMWMAARLKRATGVDPLTIDQTSLTETSMRAAYALATAKLGGRDGVLFAGDRPLVLGSYAGAVDLQVVHPPRAYNHGRPTWLAALGGRPVAIPPALLPRAGERLVQAFAADAPADAVPLDQVLVTAGRPAPAMMLPAGVKVRFAVQD